MFAAPSTVAWPPVPPEPQACGSRGDNGTKVIAFLGLDCCLSHSVMIKGLTLSFFFFQQISCFSTVHLSFEELSFESRKCLLFYYIFCFYFLFTEIYLTRNV